MSTVTELLQQEFLVSARPGAKIDCPFCTHNTFSITWNDEIGMCWHPHCQERIIAKRYDASWRYSVSNVFEQFFQKCHEHLLDYAGEDGQNPYNNRAGAR